MALILPRRSFIKAAALGSTALWLRSLLRAGEPVNFTFDPTTDIIKAPNDPALWPQYREQLAAWRERRRDELQYSDARYQAPEFAWAMGNYACYFLMLNDERFYEADADRYRTAEWLEWVRRELGGCDSVVLWHAYPRIGLDERNQFDFYRDQPGGLTGLRAVTEELQRAGVRVYINYNPWDIGTRREPKGDIDMLCEIVGALGVDGIFLDTMKEGAADFRTKLDAVRPGVVLEGEMPLPMERLADHHLAWAQGFTDSETPGIVRNKWFERRHQMHHTERFSHDRRELFQTAFMNGTGTMLWDNVFGTWSGYSPREKTILRALFPLQRRFTRLFAGEHWTPLVPTNTAGLYANLWEDENVRLWTLINRAATDATGGPSEMRLHDGERLWDLIAGVEVTQATVTIRAGGIGALLVARRDALGADFETFLAGQRAVSESASWDGAFPSEVQTRLKSPPRTHGHTKSKLPADMALIPGGAFHWVTKFRSRECGEYDSCQPRAMNRWAELNIGSWWTRDVVLPPYAMDLTPVTNAQFAEFVRAAVYRPKHGHKFLHHWIDGAPPAGQPDHPVVYVDLDDARAYAQWAGKRLPTEDEWQFAAQGTDSRKFPWGNDPFWTRHDLCNAGSATTAVRQFPAGRSPFGLYDLCGNTWEWTESEHTDGVNRFAILRGGSYFQAKGSSWYFDGGPQEVGFAAKCLLTWPGIDRAATVGFRCVVDLA